MAASPYEITCTAGTLAADNYGFQTGEAGELDRFNKATLTVTADDKTKTYGDANPPFTASSAASSTARPWARPA